MGTQSLYNLLGDNKQLLTRVQENEVLMQAIIDNAPAVIYAKNPDGTYRLVNTAFEKVLGLQREQIIGKTNKASCDRSGRHHH